MRRTTLAGTRRSVSCRSNRPACGSRSPWTRRLSRCCPCSTAAAAGHSLQLRYILPTDPRHAHCTLLLDSLLLLRTTNRPALAIHCTLPPRLCAASARLFARLFHVAASDSGALACRKSCSCLALAAPAQPRHSSAVPQNARAAARARAGISPRRRHLPRPDRKHLAQIEFYNMMK